MSNSRLCGNPEVLMSYLYEDGDEAERAAFGTHLATCDACAREVRELTAVRTGLAQWAPPETVLDFRIVREEPVARGWRSWFTFPVMPAWAQLGAAALLVGVAVGISGLEVRYDSQGLTVRTGWQKAAPAETARAAPATVPVQAVVPVATGDAAPWRADLAALERTLRGEIRQPAPVSQAVQASAPGRAMGDDEFFARVRQLIDASETRQQRELALRIAQVVRDVDTQRRTDLARLTDGMGVIEGRTVNAVAQQKQVLDYLMRVSTQRDPR